MGKLNKRLKRVSKIIKIDNEGQFGKDTKELGIHRPDTIHIDQIPIPHLESGVISINDCITVVKDFIDHDRIDGVKYCHYFWQRELKAISALDTKIDLENTFKLHKKQGFYFYKDIMVSEGVCNKIGVKKAIIHVYRNKDEYINLYGVSLDNVSLAFDYLPAGCEDCITEVFL